MTRTVRRRKLGREGAFLVQADALEEECWLSVAGVSLLRGFGFIARPLPAGPSFSLRSEPAAGRFKAATAPPSGQCSLARKTAPRASRGFTPLVRKPVSLALPSRTSESARPQPVPVDRIEGQTGRGRSRFGGNRERKTPWPSPQPVDLPPALCRYARAPPSKWSGSHAQTPSRQC